VRLSAYQDARFKAERDALAGMDLVAWIREQDVGAGHMIKVRAGGDMGEDNALPKTTAEGKQRRRSAVIAKLVGARSEVEDVLLSSNRSMVLLTSERVRLSILMVEIDDIVRRIEEC
jgi:hypothetical protein